jgi:hypothetical protein
MEPEILEDGSNQETNYISFLSLKCKSWNISVVFCRGLPCHSYILLICQSSFWIKSVRFGSKVTDVTMSKVTIVTDVTMTKVTIDTPKYHSPKNITTTTTTTTSTLLHLQY